MRGAWPARTSPLSGKARVLHTTRSLCPLCLQVLEASVVELQGKVYLTRTCPQDGLFDTYLCPSAEQYDWLRSFAFPAGRPTTQTSVQAGCPFDCGLCASHRRHPTLVEIELTRRCNLACPVCFMSAQHGVEDTPIEEIERTFAHIHRQVGTDIGIQLTGGEPTVRRDLVDIVRRGRDWGFSAIELNTNGIILARSSRLAESLREAGLSGIYLQFDGVRPKVTRRLRGADLLDAKLSTILKCRAAGLPVVLAATLIAGINDQYLGELLDFALDHRDVVCGLALQPAFQSGRFDVSPVHRLTMGDVINALAASSRGRLQPQDFWPLGCSHPLCSCGTHLYEEGGTWRPITRDLSRSEYSKLFSASSPQGSVFADIQAIRRPTWNADANSAPDRGLSILVMNYMDAWTMDLERLKECSMAVATAEGLLLPFCACHLTSAVGQRLDAPAGHPAKERV